MLFDEFDEFVGEDVSGLDWGSNETAFLVNGGLMRFETNDDVEGDEGGGVGVGEGVVGPAERRRGVVVGELQAREEGGVGGG